MSIFVDNAARHAPEKDDMPAVFYAAQAGANVIAGATRQRVVGQSLAAGFQIVEITHGLVFAPRAQGVGTDIRQVCFGKTGQKEFSQRLALLLRKPECLPDAIEGVSLRDPAGVALIDRRSQRGEPRLILLLLPLQCSQRRADNLACVFIPAALHLRQHEVVKLIGQIQVASRDGSRMRSSQPAIPAKAKYATSPDIAIALTFGGGGP